MGMRVGGYSSVQCCNIPGLLHAIYAVVSDISDIAGLTSKHKETTGVSASLQKGVDFFPHQRRYLQAISVADMILVKHRHF